MFVVTIDLSAYAIQYREAAQDLALHGQTSNGTLQSAIVKEKNKDKALLSLEDITEMLVSGRMSSGRMSMAQVQLEARLSALRESAATDNIGKGQITPAVLVEPKVPVMEMEGEDFGEAVEPIARAVPPKVEISSRITPTSVAPVVLDPPSSSEEDIAVPSITRKTSSVSTRISKNRKEIERVQDSPLDSSAAVSDSVSLSKEGDPRSPPLPTKKVKDKSRPVDAKKISGVKPQKRVGSAVIEDASEEATLKKKKKKGKDPMDDIFGL
ncbi:hypothetical protein QFC19_007102 [Naganishia cerealis]|uniref:Uncharacterized protein n=1 Tax=Naganishia cerealis TaxID=610337 RepID=A0ACC2VCC1_9TREE|nr:hypothetical protein QFC19_007102 [Naganishia cerealis]